MAFWNRKKAPRTVEVKALGSIGDPIRDFLMYGANNYARTAFSALRLYDESTAVSIPVNRIAELFANLEPVLEVDGKKIAKHPLLNLLRNPCPEFSQELFFQTLAIYYLVTGETFLLEIGNVKRPPLQLYPISPANVSHQVRNGLVNQFDITGNLYPSHYMNNNGIFISDEQMKELIQIRNFNYADHSILRGASKLIPASNAARQQLLGVKHNLSVLEKGGRLSLIFHFENDMDDDTYQAVKARVEDQFGGADRAGGIAVTGGGKLQVETPGMTNLDMDWSNAQKISSETLLLTYNLPLSLFSIAASTLDNYRTGLEAIYDDAIIPLSKVIYGGIARSTFPKFGLDGSVKLTFDKDQVSSLVMRRNTEVELRKRIGIETDNELRGIIGREAYVGGDVMYKPSSEIPIGTDILTTDDDITDEDEE